MAAILCEGIAQACSGLGEVVSTILCLPCRACGFACQGISDVLTSPFFPYLGLTFGLNLPPIVLGIKGMMLTDCQTVDNWFLVNVVLCFVHCIACLYIVHRIQHDPLFADAPAVVVATPVDTTADSKRQSFVASVFDSKSAAATPTAPSESKRPSIVASVFGGASKTDEASKMESGTYFAAPVQAKPVTASSTTRTSTTGRKAASDYAGNSMGRIKHVLCYDGGVAIYIVLGIVWIIWQGIGLSRLLNFAGDNCGGDAVRGKLVTSLLCGYVYMSFAGIGFICSLCCLR